MRPGLLLLLSAALSFAQLQGIVDIHVHTDPDSVPRSIDALDLAKLAKDAGMRGFVLKNHWAPTVQLAYTVNRVVPGIEIYGAISLDRAVGGVNPEAVRQAAAFAGKKLKIVWMPTYDSENNVRFDHKNTPFVSVARDGKLLPETMEVLGIIAKEKIVLATGHSSAEEDLLLVQEARKLSISHIVVTHPLVTMINMSIPQMKEAAQLGAYIEFCGNALLPTQPKGGQLPVAKYVKAIRAIGVEHAILSGDFGQAVNPVHTEAWKLYLDIMRRAGFTDVELDVMTRKNPAALLGLEHEVMP
jgi:hypothetical protein